MTADAKGPHALLRKRYERQTGAWVYLEEVRNGTGYRANRSADALALSLWPSRGIELHGHEIKVSRADWLRELKDVEKSQPIQRFCDRWWLVVGDPDIVQPGELPPAWGLMAVTGGNLKALVEAPKLEREPWSPVFVAAVFRGFMKDIERGWVRRAEHNELQARLDDLEPEIKQRVDAALEHERRRREDKQDEKLRASLALFEQTTGRALEAYNGRRLGELVTLAEVFDTIGHPHLLNRLCTNVELTLAKLRAAAAALGDYTGPEPLAAALAEAARTTCTCREGTMGQRCATTQRWVSFDCPVHGR